MNKKYFQEKSMFYGRAIMRIWEINNLNTDVSAKTLIDYEIDKLDAQLSELYKEMENDEEN
jgi:hypothetical protein